MIEFLFFLWIVLFLVYVEISERRKAYERDVAEWKYLMNGLGDIWSAFLLKKQLENELELYRKVSE